MLLGMNRLLGSSYTSSSQRARVISEDWAERNLYCPACPADSLSRLPANSKVKDFQCGNCETEFQLKCSSHDFGTCLLDGAYKAMADAINANRVPAMLMLRYELPDWRVRSLVAVPSFAFPLSCVQKRKALSPTARRAGYIGCNILLTSIPPDAKVPIVRDGIAEEPEKVREQFQRLKPIATLDAAKRGWTLDVLNVVRSIGKDVFTLADIRPRLGELQKLHRDNKHVEAKVRQQLQELRDIGLLQFLDNRGTYRIKF